MEDDVLVCLAGGLAERLRQHRKEGVAASVVFRLHLREATQDEDVAHLARHGLHVPLDTLGASPRNAALSLNDSAAL